MLTFFLRFRFDYVTDPCAEVECDYGAECFAKTDGTSECVCRECSERSTLHAICGSDGRTYASLCHMKLSSCKLKRSITLLKDEACGRYRSTMRFKDKILVYSFGSIILY